MTENKLFKMGVSRVKNTGIILEKELSTDEVFNELIHYANENKKLKKENEQLKSKYSEQCTQLDFLKNENRHMRDLVNENKQLKQQLASIDRLIDDLGSDEMCRQYNEIIGDVE